jgi:catechol 2,3-dioxygenase-like lactoylglutathione lyase family enzyme
MEPLWSPWLQPVATRRKSDRLETRRHTRKPVAGGCDLLPESFHGKEGVDGSSPEGGSAKSPHMGLLLSDRLADSGNVPRRSRSKIEGVSPPVTLPLIDHLALRVRDERRSRTFYEQALEPFGVKVVESSRGPGFAIEGGGDFWIEEGEPPAAPVHVAFAAADRATVDKFHRAAVEAGGRDNGAPGLRPHYHAGYYAAFVIDPDGNNVEAVFHGDRQLPAT